MSERIEKIEKKVENIQNLLRKLLSRGGTINLDLIVEELAVNVQHVGDRTEIVSTANNNGRVMFCAVKDLERKEFKESDMSAALKERGWELAHSTLASVLVQLCKDNLLIKRGKRPMIYRLPSKVVFYGDEL